jgi:hypothetical protein
MGQLIQTICKNLGLEERRFKGDIVQVMQHDIDYNAVNSKLLTLKKESEAYLDKAFNKVNRE